MIENKFIYFANRSTYDDQVIDPGISDQSIVFVGSDKSIHTHGVEFKCGDLPDVEGYVDGKIAEVNSTINTLSLDYIPNHLDILRNEIDDVYASKTLLSNEKEEVVSRFADYQPILVDGQNIKNISIDGQINNLVGSGTIAIDTYGNRCSVNLSKPNIIVHVVGNDDAEFTDECEILVYDGRGELTVDAIERGFTFTIGEITVDGITATKQDNKVVVSIDNVQNLKNINSISIPVTVTACGLQRHCTITVTVIKDGEDPVRIVVFTSTIHCNEDATVVTPSIISIAVKEGSTVHNIDWAHYNGYNFKYAYDGDTPRNIVSNIYVDHGTVLSRHQYITIYMYKNDTMIDSCTIPYVYDGKSITGAPAVDYQINIVSNTVTVGQDDTLSGKVKFILKKIEGDLITNIASTSAVYPEDRSLIYMATNGSSLIPSACYYNTSSQCWETLEISGLYTGENAFTLIQWRKENTILASIVVPFIVPGKDAVIQPQMLTGAISRVWNTYNAETTYYDGSTVNEEGVKYFDIVRFGDDYYRLAAGTGSSIGQDVYTLNGQGSPIWIRFQSSPDAWIQNLIAERITSNTLTSHQLVITTNNNEVVGGIVSGDTVPQELLTLDITSNVDGEKVRIFAGHVPTHGNIQEAAFNVTEHGSVKASGGKVSLKADGSGYVADGNILWDSNGKLTINGDVAKIITDDTDIKTCTNCIIVSSAIADFSDELPLKWTYTVSGNVFKEGRLISTFNTGINIWSLMLLRNNLKTRSNNSVTPSITDLLLLTISSTIDDIYLKNCSRFAEDSTVCLQLPLVQVGFGGMFEGRFVSRVDVFEAISSGFESAVFAVDNEYFRTSELSLPNVRPIIIYYSDKDEQPANPTYLNTLGWYESIPAGAGSPTDDWKRFVAEPKWYAYKTLATYADHYSYSSWTVGSMADLTESTNEFGTPVTILHSGNEDGQDKQDFAITDECNIAQPVDIYENINDSTAPHEYSTPVINNRP